MWLSRLLKFNLVLTIIFFRVAIQFFFSWRDVSQDVEKREGTKIEKKSKFRKEIGINGGGWAFSL